MKLYPCRVTKIHRETKHCVSVFLDVPEDYPVNWLPGQHLVVQLAMEGQSLRRCFSLSQAAAKQQVRLTVKDNGQKSVSAYINRGLAKGDELYISAPMGKFFLQPSPEQRKSYYFFAAGSGITPIFAQIQALLEQEPLSHLYCLYANKDHKSIILLSELQQLQQKYADRFVLLHALSGASWLSSFNAWRYGRIDQAVVEAFIQQNPPYAQECEYYICGPGGFIRDIQRSLGAIDVPRKLMFSESFAGQVDQLQVGRSNARLTVELEQQHQLQLVAGQTLLDAMLQQGINVPYSCQAGVCGRCACQLNKGKVLMHSHMALDEQQLKNNIILACQAVADCEELTISYD